MFQTNSSGPLAEQILPIHAKSTYSNTCCKCAANELCKVPFSFRERRETSRSLLLTLKSRFVHAGHARTVVLAGEALDVHLQRNGAHWWPEVEQTHLQENNFFTFNLDSSYQLLFCFLHDKYISIFENFFHTWLMFSQSARSLALAKAVDKPTTLTGFSVWDEIKFVRDTMTSNTGPLSSPGKWKVNGKTEKKERFRCQNVYSHHK